MGIQFLVPFLVPLALQASTLYMCPHVSRTERMVFSKQDACGNLVVASLPVNFPFSAFCQRFLLQMSVGLNTIHTFLVNRLIVACLMTASSCFAQGNSAGLPCYKSFAAGFSTYPCHMACVSKSVTKNIISLSDYVPNSTEAPWM
jgi:hypothetical protein